MPASLSQALGVWLPVPSGRARVHTAPADLVAFRANCANMVGECGGQIHRGLQCPISSDTFESESALDTCIAQRAGATPCARNCCTWPSTNLCSIKICSLPGVASALNSPPSSTSKFEAVPPLQRLARCMTDQLPLRTPRVQAMPTHTPRPPEVCNLLLPLTA